jgi:hypothetical protein
MRNLIGWRGVLAAVFIVVGLYVVNTSPGVKDGSKVNNLVTLPDNVITLPQVSPLPQPPNNPTIALSLPVKAMIDVTGQDEILDADDLSFVHDDSPQQNVGAALDPDDMSFIYDDSPQQNVGEPLDPDDMSFVYDDSPQQNVGAALDVDPMDFVYDDSPQQNVGKALDVDAQ